jgi:hypothetical protein
MEEFFAVGMANEWTKIPGITKGLNGDKSPK